MHPTFPEVGVADFDHQTHVETCRAFTHAPGHGCKPCREIQREGPKRPGNSLLRHYGKSEGSVTTTGQHSPAVVPAKSKRSLQNEVRRQARVKAMRNREKRALVALLRGEG